MRPPTPPGPLGHIVENMCVARTALGMPGVSWAAEYEELETLMRRHPAYAAYLLPRITRTSRSGGPAGGWAVVAPPPAP